ncbi:uncharacterized protein LOC141715150 [Apium graveolens]|uniref:uncharacterized protein LOC141715150 n=1 Tax=Apium graveolens TaxID=4045 RepID=UPI003D7BB57A
MTHACLALTSTKARAWLKEIEKAFALVKVEEDQKIDFASYFLRGEVNYWWESKKALEGDVIVTWDRFTEIFLEKFVPEQVDIDEKRAKRFQQGLRPWIHSKVAVFELTTYTAVVRKAMIIEGESEMSQKEKGQGSFHNRFHRRPGFQARTNTNFKRIEHGNQRLGNQFQAPNQQRIIRPPLPYCKTLGKKHKRICNKPNVMCFKCKQKGHYSGEVPIGKTEITYFQCGRKGHTSKDCRGATMAARIPKVLALPPPPQKNQPRTRTFNMSMKEAVQNQNVVAGCEGYLAYVLDMEKESPSIEDTPVVCEFPDVFPDKLPGLPPDREIKFTIDLAPGTETVSKALYQMTAVEMKEMATQLQDLVNK